VSIPDLSTPSENALRDLRTAKAILQLAKVDKSSLEKVLGALSGLKDEQASIAAALVLRQALARPRHDRILWLESAKDLLMEHGLCPEANKTDYQEAIAYIETLLEDAESARQRRERLVDRLTNGLLAVLIAGLLWLIGAYAWSVVSGMSEGDVPKAGQTEGKAGTTPLETPSDK